MTTTIVVGAAGKFEAIKPIAVVDLLQPLTRIKDGLRLEQRIRLYEAVLPKLEALGLISSISRLTLTFQVDGIPKWVEEWAAEPTVKHQFFEGCMFFGAGRPLWRTFKGVPELLHVTLQ